MDATGGSDRPVELVFSRDLASRRRCSRSAISSLRDCWSLGISMGATVRKCGHASAGRRPWRRPRYVPHMQVILHSLSRLTSVSPTHNVALVRSEEKIVFYTTYGHQGRKICLPERQQVDPPKPRVLFHISRPMNASHVDVPYAVRDLSAGDACAPADPKDGGRYAPTKHQSFAEKQQHAIETRPRTMRNGPETVP